MSLAGSVATLGRGLRLAVGTLTIVPVGQVGEITPSVARAAMALAPLAAFPIALLAATLTWLMCWIHVPLLIIGVLVVAAMAWSNRAMHLDGLADTVDGFGAGWSREKALQVMKTGDVGPMGACALGLVLLGEAAAVGALSAFRHGWLMVALAVLASRSVLALVAMQGFPAARNDGLGVELAEAVPRWLTAVLAVVAIALFSGVGVLAGMVWWRGGFAVMLGWVVALIVVLRAKRVFGGVTGDVMGACVELACVTMLVTLAAGSGA